MNKHRNLVSHFLLILLKFRYKSSRLLIIELFAETPLEGGTVSSSATIV